MHIQLLVAALLGLIVSGLLIALFAGSKNRHGTPRRPAERRQTLRTCPLCHTGLAGSERVHSVVYPGKPDKMMHIFGCPYCKGPVPRNARECPVCHIRLAPEDYVVARVFDRFERMHVHVLGCTKCRRSFSKNS